jgi:putative oxidoreductase
MSSNLWGVPGIPIHPEIMECPPIQPAKGKPSARHRPGAAIRTVSTIARVLLGIQFVVFGFNGFVRFLPAPPSIPPHAFAFYAAITVPHFTYFVFGVQLIAGLLVLVNRYVPLALVALGAVLANIFAFHITMWPQAIFPMPILALALWFLTAWPIRSQFAPIFAQKVEAA